MLKAVNNPRHSQAKRLSLPRQRGEALGTADSSAQPLPRSPRPPVITACRPLTVGWRLHSAAGHLHCSYLPGPTMLSSAAVGAFLQFQMGARGRGFTKAEWCPAHTWRGDFDTIPPCSRNIEDVADVRKGYTRVC